MPSVGKPVLLKGTKMQDHTDHHHQHQHGQHAHEHADQGEAHHSNHGGHADHSGHEDIFRQRFWISLLLSLPVLIYSPMLQEWLGFTAPGFTGSQWVGTLFAVIVFVYGGWPFLDMARPEIRRRQPGMMTLISLAILVSFVYSLAAVVLNLGDGFFWELVTLIDIMLLGHWIEMRSVRQASGALNELAKLMPDEAELLDANGATRSVPVSELRNGDRVLVRPGGSVPADGEVVEGASDVNEAMITGESKPVRKSQGDQVIGGSINGEGSLRVRVTATGDETALAGIMRLVEQAQQSKSNTQILADRAAGWLFYIALASALVTALAWTIADGFNLFALQRVVTVLVIACPHALGLAVPLVVAITTSSAARNGLLIRDRLALEEAREINMVVFDKTGTLTRGELGVVAIATIEGWQEDQALALAAAIEADSEHSLARGIRQAAAEKELQLPPVQDFEAIKGHGVQANSEGRSVVLGGPRMLEKLGLQPGEQLAAFSQSHGAQGQTVVYLVVDEMIVAALALADVIRPESAAVVRHLHELGIQVAMLTGDSQDVARAVADDLEIDQYFAQVLPDQKDGKIVELQQQGLKVAMVGDGINDAPALARADVGIAIGSGTDVAVESAGIILVNSDPRDVLKIFTLSRASYAKMIQNLVWATGYNVIAIPLAAGLLAAWGILLSPALGALLMSVSTVVVAINAQLLRNLNLETVT